MARKTYRTYRLKGLQLLMSDESGRLIEVNFKGGCQIDSTAKFTTSNEKLQQLLENSNGFNRDFYIESVSEGRPAANTEEVSVVGGAPDAKGTDEGNGVQKVEVADKGDAIEWLKEHFPERGYTAAKLRSKAAFDGACTESNVQFVFAE